MAPVCPSHSMDRTLKWLFLIIMITNNFQLFGLYMYIPIMCLNCHDLPSIVFWLFVFLLLCIEEIYGGVNEE